MSNSPLCRIEPDHKRFLHFLEANEYPIRWTLDLLRDAIVVRLFDDRGTLGYFWGHWVETGIMAFHVCIDVDRRGRDWFSPSVLSQLYQIAFWLGADELLTSLDGVPNAVRIRALLLRLGFKEEPGVFDKDFVFTINLWEHFNGRTLQPVPQT